MTARGKKICFLIILIVSTIFVNGQNPFFKNYGKTEGLPGKSSFVMHVDKDNRLWVGTNRGIAYLKGSRFIIPNQPNSLKSSNVMEISETRNGQIWVINSSGEVYFGNTETPFKAFKTPNEFNEKVQNRIINSFLVNDKNEISLGTVIGGGYYQYKDNNLLENYTEQRDHSFFLKEIVDNQFVWGSNGPFPPNNILKFNGSDNSELLITLSNKSGFSKSSFIQTSDGIFLFAKDYEIIQFNRSEVVQRTFLSQKVECVFESKDEKIWVGLNNGGVICFLTDHLTTDISSRYLSKQTVTDIVEVGNGNIWFSTMENGLFMLPGQPEISYSEPKILLNNSRKITPNPDPVVSEGSSETPLLPILPGENSTLISRSDSTYPVVYISRIEINDEDTALHNIYHLNYDQNYIKIHFSGLINNQPKQLQYRYMVNGISDPEWNYTDLSYAQFGKLLPGEYVFTVYAMDNNGFWSKTPANVTFVIAPPFWNTTQFYAWLIIVLLVILVTALFFGLRRSRTKALRNKQSLMSELKILRAQMNPHFTFNTLSSIQHFIGNNNNDAAIDYLSKFGKLLRSIMENTKKPAIPIQDEIGALRLYLDLERLRLNNKFDYSIKIDPEIDEQYDQIPSLLIQPYVENAIWHGFTNVNKSGKINIELKRKGKFIICTIEDNGIGRQAAKELNGQKKKHNSMGMEITKERLQIINALKNSALSVDIHDLENENGVAIGTKVEIFIPFEED